MKRVKSLQESGLLMGGMSETIKNEAEKQILHGKPYFLFFRRPEKMVILKNRA